MFVDLLVALSAYKLTITNLMRSTSSVISKKMFCCSLFSGFDFKTRVVAVSADALYSTLRNLNPDVTENDDLKTFTDFVNWTFQQLQLVMNTISQEIDVKRNTWYFAQGEFYKNKRNCFRAKHLLSCSIAESWSSRKQMMPLGASFCESENIFITKRNATQHENFCSIG